MLQVKLEKNLHAHLKIQMISKYHNISNTWLTQPEHVPARYYHNTGMYRDMFNDAWRSFIYSEYLMNQDDQSPAGFKIFHLGISIGDHING